MNARVVQVLLLEDYPAYAEVLRDAMDEVAAGAYALHCIQHMSQVGTCFNEGRYDLILIDLGLPGADGLSRLAQVVSRAGGLPIIALTGVDDEDVGEAAVKAGGDDYLVKTQIGGQRLWRVIRYAIERHRLHAEHKETERLRVVCETAGAVAHEINQPLTAIVGYVDLILHGLPKHHKLRPELNKILDAGMNIKGIVKRMQNIKQYVTKSYLGDIDIVDFQAASERQEGLDGK
jgi:CheY-like chemotaxis protein